MRISNHNIGWKASLGGDFPFPSKNRRRRDILRENRKIPLSKKTPLSTHPLAHGFANLNLRFKTLKPIYNGF